MAPVPPAPGARVPMAQAPDVSALGADFEQSLAAARTVADVKAVRDRFLSRKHGLVTNLLKAMGSAPPDERRALGAAINTLKQTIETALAVRESAVEALAVPAGAVDVTLPGRVPPLGRRHPLTQVRERIEDIFLGMGYEIIEGPELEDDWHNFEALNMPAEHPARDMQDTLYLSEKMPADARGRHASLLRTHTSGMQIRYMETHEPPVRIIAPGRVYRRDDFDATHTPMFTQVEGSGRRRGRQPWRSERHAPGVRRAVLRRAGQDAPAAQLLPVHRALGRARRRVSGLRRRRMRAVQAHGLD